MMHTQRFRSPSAQPIGRGLSSIQLVLAAVLAMGLAYAVVLAQPSLVHALRGVFGQLPAGGASASWALPAAAAGIAVAGGTLGVLVLSAVARLSQRNPFLWLGPVLVAFSMIVLAGVRATLPWPALPLPGFAMLAGIAMLCGGAVLQMPGRASRVAGGLLLALPLVALLAGYAATPQGVTAALAAAGRGGMLVAVILALTAAGLATTALVSRAEDLEAVQLLRHTLEHQRLQLIDALERGRASEARVQEVERRAELLEHGIATPSVALSDDEALRAMKGPSSAALTWALGASAVLLALSCGVLFFGLYQPAARKLQAQHARLASADAAHAKELAALRADFDAQRGSLAALLETERVGRAAASTSAEDASAKLAACEQAAASASEAASSAEVERRGKPARKKRIARRARKAAPVAASPASEESDLDRKMSRALRDAASANDDPIGGL